MKRPTLFLLAFLLPVTATASAQAVRLNGDTHVKLVARGEEEATARALVVMDKYLRHVLGKETLRSGEHTVRVLLEAKAAKWSDIPRDQLAEVRDVDAYDIVVDNGDVPTIHITGNTGAALTSGVYDFLENRIGVTWLFPGPMGVALPPEREFLLTAGSKKVRPEFVSRIYTGVRPSHYPDYYESLKLRHLIFSSHAMIRIFPIEESRRLHPEIFPVKDGERHIPDPDRANFGHGQHWHPCYTNPKTVEVATRKALEFFENRSGLTFSLGINDGTRLQCDCESCRAAGWPQSYYQFVNRVAANVKAHYPPFMVGVLAYGDVGLPPEDLKLAENVLVLGGDTSCFIGKAKHLGVYEYLYGGGYWVPHFPLEGMRSNAQYHRQMGAIALHCEVRPIWAFDAPKVYLRSKLLWDADYDVDAGLERWCRAAFGAGWQPMLRFYRLWAAKRDDAVKPDGITATADIAMWRNSNAQFATTSAHDYGRCAEWIALAREQAQDPLVSKRLDMIESFFNYSRTAFEMWQSKQQIFDCRPGQDWSALAGRALALQQRRENLLDTMRNHKEWFYGTTADVDNMLGAEWEARWTWTVFYENDNALRTALHNAREAGQPAPESLPDRLQRYTGPARHVRLDLEKFDQAINYYHHDIYNQMKVEPRPGTAAFNLDTTAPRAIPGDTPHAWLAPNGLKRQWFRASVPLDQEKHYRFDISVAGTNGKADIRVHNENDCGMKAWLTEGFGEKEATRNKRLLLKPVPAWGSGGDSRPVSTWSVEIIFTPDRDDARFRGECSVDEVEFTEQ